ncbi:hypothetical protein [Albibacterium indicum]|uniref:hypothetical protein n=1 Tax=Albibacterium indicum TaxID=2292082 RepID=UPI000E4A5EA5|nr:hypothetical protein [Pedobacter indicus]
MKSNEVRISRKKPIFPVIPSLQRYLQSYQRATKLPLRYSELLHFDETIPVIDKNGKDTLWESPLYPSHEIDRIHEGLKIIYAKLKASGNTRIVEHKFIERIEYCTFGNTHPFRIKIVNRLNDVYDYFYVKQADASRIYGLELEEILSPNQVNYLVDGDTLIEEHIAGIPGDVFASKRFDKSDYNHKRIAKEFVKFNERCVITLLGDMRSYNFVVQITPDFDDFQFRLRAIDFDQQGYEGNVKIYLPQFFRDNYVYVQISMANLTEKTVLQYQQEERSSLIQRARMERHRIAALRDASAHHVITTDDNINRLKKGLSKYFKEDNYDHCKTMTDLIEQNLRNVINQVAR